jgi:hypothetical protein
MASHSAIRRACWPAAEGSRGDLNTRREQCSRRANAHNGRVDHLDGRIVSGGKCVHDSPLYSGPSPDETVVAGGAWTIAVRQIASWRAGSQHPADAVGDASVVHTRHASRLVRQHWPDGRPFIIREFVAHHPKLVSWELVKCGGRHRQSAKVHAADANIPIRQSAFRA